MTNDMKGQIGCRKSGPLLMWVFLVCAFCLFSNTASAQLVQSTAIENQNTNWLNPNAAEQVLLNEMHLLQLDLPGLTPGTTQYIDNVRRQAYYKAILVAMRGGAPISGALESSLPAAATLGGEEEGAFTPKAALRALYNETRTLLSQ
jgi:hypothetical protein